MTEVELWGLQLLSIDNQILFFSGNVFPRFLKIPLLEAHIDFVEPVFGTWFLTRAYLLFPY